MLDHVVVPTSVKIQIELTQLPKLARLLASLDSGHQIRIHQQQWKLLREAIPLEGRLPRSTKHELHCYFMYIDDLDVFLNDINW